ncbi:hypothetical protein DCS_00222 [Drechmeria coniospora]|uniref:Uncharacterized protein n=1 Tax=Drechmeria coniospora TaxID=98403 RepID=A0A151GPQ5_DRECN|nr:hypothetical protein DCS_00222 [Drechmeria coniospora]KYK59094.1 hypothetical protein DCS_00222 [Drechmeria coniospora]
MEAEALATSHDIKLLMANTLYEPAWANEWDRHFKANGTIDLRTWERYGMLSKHRRQRTAELGIEEARIHARRASTLTLYGEPV